MSAEPKAFDFETFLKTPVPIDCSSTPWLDLWREARGWVDFESRVKDWDRGTMERILFENQDLCSCGFGAWIWVTADYVEGEYFFRARENMTSAHSLEQFRAARAWIRKFPKLRRINRRGTSYGLKHIAEREIGYLTNGCLIAAALAEGFPVRRIEDSPNARVGVSAAAWR